MGTVLNGRLAIQRFERSAEIIIRDRIAFTFYKYLGRLSDANINSIGANKGSSPKRLLNRVAVSVIQELQA